MKKIDFEKISIIILSLLLVAFLIVGTLVFRDVMKQESSTPGDQGPEVQTVPPLLPNHPQSKTMKGNE